MDHLTGQGMYEDFYGLKEKPFSKTPDPRFLYQSRSHREALARLEYAAEAREFMVLTGEIGCGKTTLSRALLDLLDESYKPVLIINPRVSPNQFLRAVSKGLGIEKPRYFRADLLEELYETLYNLYEEGISPVIMIDEAQLIPGKETFEEIRLLTNFQLDDTNLITLILIGQPELQKRLDSRHYRALRQRIGMFFHLSPLSPEDTENYINFRLSVAGRKEPLFTKEAISLIHRISSGIPRKINNIASNALLEGFGREAPMIDEDIVIDVAKDMGELKGLTL